ncbi:branched-chain amino acid aminotransferase [Lentisphaerota bacterium WC36G]|nr:branched-chain amino acid aminotransferase [Lentisphaerae bacterium WC36]
MDIDWKNLGFQYMPVNCNIRYSYKNGEWGKMRLHENNDINLSIAASCLHYGQAAFEGLKAFRCKDGKVKVFRPQENAKRMNLTNNHLLMPEIPEAMFLEALENVVRENIEFVPPYGTGGALYIRPLTIGTTAQIGIAAAADYEFIMLATPVGPYYKGGIKPVRAMISDAYDRAAPLGTGHVKVAGNYAASLAPTKLAKESNCQVALFLDAKTRSYIEEFGTSNFIGVTADNHYVTPQSPSILESITNISLRELASDIGLTVEHRPIPVAELDNFVEVGACGTAVVITPVGEIVSTRKTYNYGENIGPVLQKLYDKMTGIQYGEEEDTHNWMYEITE